MVLTLIIIQIYLTQKVYLSVVTANQISTTNTTNNTLAALSTAGTLTLQDSNNNAGTLTALDIIKLHNMSGTDNQVCMQVTEASNDTQIMYINQYSSITGYTYKIVPSSGKSFLPLSMIQIQLRCYTVSNSTITNGSYYVNIKLPINNTFLFSIQSKNKSDMKITSYGLTTDSTDSSLTLYNFTLAIFFTFLLCLFRMTSIVLTLNVFCTESSWDLGVPRIPFGSP